MWNEMIFPHHKVLADRVKERGCFLSLHSDGNVNAALPGILELGYDVVHPWQEAAGMGYDSYLRDYADRLGLLGGLCIQTTLGFGNLPHLESEIRRVFGLLKGKRWMFCTTHYVQDHCSIEELVFAYDLAVKLARG
jgi:uroporphyrinogen decarboxylase